MWGKAKRALNDRLNRIEQALQALAAQAGASPGGSQALEKFATAAVESQANNLRAMGDFMGTIAEIGARRAASVMGKRRASTAKRDSKGRMLKSAKATDCRLCGNPNLLNPTADEIREHFKHSEQSAPPPIVYQDDGKRLIAHVHEDHVQTGHDGTEQIECPDCKPPGRQVH